MRRLQLLLLTSVLPLAAHAADVTATDGGLVIDAGPLGKLNLGWPTLNAAKTLKPVEVRATKHDATLKYEGGIELKATITADGLVTLQFAKKPAGVKSLRLDGQIDFNFSNGGTWHVGDKPDQPFPALKPAKPFLYQDQATSLTIADLNGKALTFSLPPWSWLQLQDNREWGWKIFGWFFQTPLTDALKYQVGIGTSLPATGTPERKQCDKFGQNPRAEFAGKVKSADELKADLAADEAYYGALRPPATDQYGGQPGSGAKLGLKQTGFFHMERQGDRWVLVDPAGNAFFHRGICGFQPSDDYTFIAGRENIYEWLPRFDGEYHTAFRQGDGSALSFYVTNVIRKYGKPYEQGEWTTRMIDRVRRLGFSSAGAFTGLPKAAREAANFPFTAHLPLDPWDAKIPRIPGINETWDPFDAGNRARVESNFATKIAAAADDPLIIGYYLINEPLYEDIPRVVPTLSAKYACKLRLVQMLKDKYQTIEALNAAWNLRATDWDKLNGAGLPVTTQAAADDMQEYTGLFHETYYKLVCDTFHKYDTHHLLIGNRFQMGTINNEQLSRIAGKYLDVMSFNYYTYYLDLDFLKRVHTWTGGKPMILSEFHWSCPAESGLPGGAKDVATQEQRGLAYRNYVEQAAATGFVVGIEWFTLLDQALTGRWFSKYNGENGNTGLFSVADRPWKVALAPMMQTNYRIYDVEFGAVPPFVYDNPRFSSSGATKKVVKVMRATGPVALDGTAKGFPGVPSETIPGGRIVLGASAGGVEATFKLCWDATNLYLLANVTDPTPLKNDHTGGDLWEADGLEVFIGPDKPEQSGPLLFTDRQLLLSAAPAPKFWFGHAPRQEKLSLVAVPSVDGRGYVLEAAVPWASLGFTPREGQTIRFDLAVDDSHDGKSRKSQLMWSGTDNNSRDRSAWGTAVFGP